MCRGCTLSQSTQKLTGSALATASTSTNGISCGGQCVDPSNPNYCNNCSPCTSGQICAADSSSSTGFSCQQQCPAGQTACGGKCVDTTSDPANCGGCSNACTAPTGGTTTCANGQCGQSCASGQTACGNSCVSTQIDSNNCGSCGHACTNGQTCQSGSCQCLLGHLGDNNNCGTCGNVCPSGQGCSGGLCQPNPNPCLPGQLVQSDDTCGFCDPKSTIHGPSGCICIDPTQGLIFPPNNPVLCEPCPSGQTGCNGSCVDPKTAYLSSNVNCGSLRECLSDP